MDKEFEKSIGGGAICLIIGMNQFLVIIAFRIKNFLSFGEEQEISFDANNALFGEEQAFSLENLDILRTASVFGPNGSGKTNLILAIVYSLDLMGLYDFGYDRYIKPHEMMRLKGDVSHFADSSISKFEFTITGPEGIYRYGFEYDSLKEVVTSEFALDLKCNDYLFKREGIQCADIFGSEYRLKESHASKLLLRICNECNDYPNLDFARMIRLIFAGVVIGTYDFFSDLKTVSENQVFMCDRSCIDVLNYVLPRITDVDHVVLTNKRKDGNKSQDHVVILENLVIVDHGLQQNVMFKEKGFTRSRSFLELSAGTQRIIILVLMICSSRHIHEIMVKRQKTYLSKLGLDRLTYDPEKSDIFVAIDELCYSLHPKVIFNLIQLLYSEGMGFENLQLLITAHDTNLMSSNVLNPDKIYLMESVNGESHLSRLSNYDIFNNGHTFDNKSVLKAAYLEGRFGGVPKIGNARRLL